MATATARWVLLVEGERGRGDDRGALPPLAELLGYRAADASALVDELADVTGHWPADPRPSVWSRSAGESAVAALARYLLDQPRTVVGGRGAGFLLDAWQRAADRAGAHLATVIVVRHPTQCCDGNSVAEIAGWLNLVTGFERATRPMRRAVVRHEDLVEDWQDTLTRIEQQTGALLVRGASVAQLSEAALLAATPPIDDEDAAGPALAGLPPRLRDLAARTYAVLRSLSEGRGDLALLDSLRQEYVAVADLPGDPEAAWSRMDG